MGSISNQLGLLSTLAAYESAERAAKLCPDVREQWAKADQLHARLTSICFACGFEPGGQHRNVSIVEFAHQRAAVLRRVFPNHCNEAGL